MEVGKVSYLQIDVAISKSAKLDYRLVGPSASQPIPPEGYKIDPEPILVEGVQGKYWLEYKITET